MPKNLNFDTYFSLNPGLIFFFKSQAVSISFTLLIFNLMQNFRKTNEQTDTHTHTHTHTHTQEPQGWILITLSGKPEVQNVKKSTLEYLKSQKQGSIY